MCFLKQIGDREDPPPNKKSTDFRKGVSEVIRPSAAERRSPSRYRGLRKRSVTEIAVSESIDGNAIGCI